MRKLQKNQFGDTLVEVLLATVVLSIILAGAYSLSNRATRINQQSYDRSKATSISQQQAELVRSARDSFDPAAGGTQLWDNITNSTTTVQPLGNDCETLGDLNSDRPDAYHIDGSNTYQNTVALQDTLFYVWAETSSPAGNPYYDVHVFVCWEGIGEQQAQKQKLVLRLEENND